MDKKTLNYQTVLITGGAGFVGSNIAVTYKRKYGTDRVICLDNLKRRGSELNLPRLRSEGVEFVHGDIRNFEDLSLDFKIDLLIECSAEPSVLAGYGGSPAYVINSNLTGTINCLEAVRKNKADVVFLSTSRVYPFDVINSIAVEEKETRFEWKSDQGRGIPGWSPEGISHEFTVEGAKSMYGATKLCSEIILREYMDMYGLKAVINRCGVIAGPWQFGKADQGVFTLWILAHFFKKDLRYIGFGGKGKQVRDLLHIDDLFDLLELQLLNIERASGNIYNVGGGSFSSLSLLETTRLCEEITGNNIKITPEEARPADIRIYITDNTSVSRDFFWRPKCGTKEILSDIFNWVRENEADIKKSVLA